MGFMYDKEIVVYCYQAYNLINVKSGLLQRYVFDKVILVCKRKHNLLSFLKNDISFLGG